jgi:helicase
MDSELVYMKLSEIDVPEKLKSILKFDELRPSQAKAIEAGLLKRENLLVCTPTASGKTLIAELAMMKGIIKRVGKAIYIVPLKALASEKLKDFTKKYGHLCKIVMSIGDLDKKEDYLGKYDMIITTSEKLDSLIRHHTPWLRDVGTIVVDEVHLLNDPGRGPTLEILITILKKILSKAQFICLSATIGNPDELANWLDARLVIDKWRPVKLHKGILFEEKMEFYEKEKE